MIEETGESGILRKSVPYVQLISVQSRISRKKVTCEMREEIASWVLERV